MDKKITFEKDRAHHDVPVRNVLGLLCFKMEVK